MTNAELIAALRVEPFEVGSVGMARILNQAANALEAAEKRIEELEAQMPKEGEWISVEDRLPEIDQEVLIYAIGKIDGFIGDSVIAISERFVFRFFPSSDGVEEWRSPWQYFSTDYEITHWMPLPEAPEGEQE